MPLSVPLDVCPDRRQKYKYKHTQIQKYHEGEIQFEFRNPGSRGTCPCQCHWMFALTGDKNINTNIHKYKNIMRGKYSLNLEIPEAGGHALVSATGCLP